LNRIFKKGFENIKVIKQEVSMTYTKLQDPVFDHQISLRDAYKVMEGFVSDYISRGDTTITDFLYTYANLIETGETVDPAALDDFLLSVNDILADINIGK
jgi:hypothetical protein